MERWIDAGRIQVNGERAKLGDRVSDTDRLQVDGRNIVPSPKNSVPRVLLYHKPLGEVCTRKDPENRPTVYSRLPRLTGQRWISIGRLDINTTGLLLFTTDGELANRLMHPSTEIEREYAVRVMGEVEDEMIERLKEGVMLEDGPAKFTDVVASGGEGINRWFHACPLEGRNREVRRLWESQGLRVNRLKRVRFGPVFLGPELPVGRWRELKQNELDALSLEVGLDPIKLPVLKTSEKEKQQRLARKPSMHQARQPRRTKVPRK